MTPPRRHLGSELPAFSDKLGKYHPLPANCLTFSNGRGAITWYLRHKGLKSVLICAYSCPSLIAAFHGLGVEVSYFDIGEPGDAVAAQCPGDTLPIITALFGGKPVLNPHPFGWPLIDASQSAFAYMHYSGCPILASPRKTTSLPDGAVLRFTGARRKWTDDLPLAPQPVAYKTTARTLWYRANNDLAVFYNQLAEDAWPVEPCRMSPESLWTLEHMDVAWHANRRRKNYKQLARILKGIPVHKVRGVPFCYPILVSNRDEVLDILHYERIYATKLWWDAEFDRSQFPVSARYADQLICLPVDQRHTETDMERIADIVRYVAEY